MKKKFVAEIIDTAKWVAVCTLMVSILLAMLVLLPPARAKDFSDTIGKVAIDEVIDGVFYTIEQYDSETWIIPVKTNFGIIKFFADNPKWEGEVYLLLFGENMEVIDAFMIKTLEAPFGEFSFFIFYGHIVSVV